MRSHIPYEFTELAQIYSESFRASDCGDAPKLIREYEEIQGHLPVQQKHLKILDVGSGDVNGTYADLLKLAAEGYRGRSFSLNA